MGTIFLVRHGQDTDNAAGILNGRRDTRLTELGREQARIVAQKLQDDAIHIIYASPLARAHETASLIAKELGVDDVIPDERLMERDFGVLTGKPVSDIPKLTDKILVSDGVNYFLEVEGAEDLPATLERGRDFLREIQNKHPEENVLVVTHGDIGKMIRAAYHGWTWEEGLKTPYFANTEVLELFGKEDKVE